MATQTSADGGRTANKRFSDDVSADNLAEGDRIAPELIPRSPEIEVGEDIAPHLARQYDEDEDRTFSVRLVAAGEDRWGDVQTALIYDPDADLYIRLSGHTSSGAMNQIERDWKVRDIGREIVVEDVWNVEMQDFADDYDNPQTFVEEWVEIMADNIRGGEMPAELVRFDGKTFKLEDWDNRVANVQYTLQ